MKKDSAWRGWRVGGRRGATGQARGGWRGPGRAVTLLMAAAAVVVGGAGVVGAARCQSAGARPNVLLIMADDLGYADLGCYGGEIDTPHLDRLAEEGVRLTRFRVAPMCTVSRVALLSGLPFGGGGSVAYRQSVPFPELLRESGYTTMMSGKWHAGSPDPRRPPVFDRFYGFLGGMTDSFVGGPGWFSETQPVTTFPPDFYSTEAFATRAIDNIDDATALGAPWLMFLSFNAPHHPCQAPRETFEKYRGRYMDGYQKIHARRMARQVELGLIDPDLKSYPPGPEVRRWEEMPAARREIEDQRMAAYAAAVDEIDQHVGRVLEHLDQRGLSENTLVVFLSDNGADYNNGNRLTDAQQTPWLPKANPTPSNGWSWVRNTPFRSFKHSSYEGALASPLIVRWPAGLQAPPGSLIRQPTHITDLYPTLLELAGRDYPTRHAGKTLLPLAGRSWVPLLDGRAEDFEPRPAFAWYDTSRAWIQDEWKAVQLYRGPWQLYDLRADRGEVHDLAAQHPEKLRQMVEAWDAQSATQQGPPPPPARSFPPADTPQPGWGLHRLDMITAGRLHGLRPDNGAMIPPQRTTLELDFAAPVDFSAAAGRGIRLYRVRDESAPVWQARPTADHPSQGQTTVRFDDLPPLEPDTSYFVEWDPGWLSVGGQPVGPLNDGAYWWRFRTTPAPAASSTP